MNILMFTNTFVPHVGGVARSILTLRGELERRGHRVNVVAPSYPGFRHDEPGVLRIPAIDGAAGSDYALPIPLSRHIRDEVEAFAPDVIHTHHPFLLGDTALRMAASLGVPAVYTYHTRYEFYLGSALRADGARLKRMARGVVDGFADLADAVIAPSESLRDLLIARGVTSPIRVVPTGIDLDRMKRGDRDGMRARLGFSDADFVVGHLGRLAEEKNLGYLARAVAVFLRSQPQGRFILSGHGEMLGGIRDTFEQAGVGDRVQVLDVLEGDDFASFYAAMDVFAFTSLSETQGLVVTEAMAAGTPVIALDAPGVREGVGDDGGGRLLPAETTPDDFAQALSEFAASGAKDTARRRRAARQAAERFSIAAMGDGAETLYAALVRAGRKNCHRDHGFWESSWAALSAEVGIVENLLHAAGVALRPGAPEGSR